jgi:hypothetical protein
VAYEATTPLHILEAQKKEKRERETPSMETAASGSSSIVVGGGVSRSGGGAGGEAGLGLCEECGAEAVEGRVDQGAEGDGCFYCCVCWQASVCV